MRAVKHPAASASHRMHDMIKTILAAKRRHFLHSKPVFHYFGPATEMELFMTARKLNCKLALNLSRWLRAAGYGDLNGTLSFRHDYFAVVAEGALAGCITFARDELGNTYAFSQEDGVIYYIDRHGDSYARMANDFMAFMLELIQRDYNLAEWRDSLPAKHDLAGAHGA
jgi:hypothetical protein